MSTVNVAANEKSPDEAGMYKARMDAAVKFAETVLMHGRDLHQMGLDPNKLAYFYGGLDQKLVGVEHVDPIEDVI